LSEEERLAIEDLFARVRRARLDRSLSLATQDVLAYQLEVTEAALRRALAAVSAVSRRWLPDEIDQYPYLVREAEARELERQAQLLAFRYGAGVAGLGGLSLPELDVQRPPWEPALFYRLRALTKGPLDLEIPPDEPPAPAAWVAPVVVGGALLGLGLLLWRLS